VLSFDRQRAGVVDRIDACFLGHPVIVRFPSVAVPPFGASWVGAFAPGELVVLPR
jgi:hypothetical protein